MAIQITKPDPAISQYQKALDTMALIKEIATNPDIHKTFAQLSKSVIETHTITAQKQQETIDAQEVIAQAQETKAEIARTKTIHDAAVAKDLKEIENKRTQLQAEISAHEVNKEKSRQLLEKAHAAADEKLAIAKQLSEEARDRHLETDKREKALSERENLHLLNVQEFNKEQSEIENSLSVREEEHKAKVAAFLEEKKAHDLRKKKFEDALKG